MFYGKGAGDLPTGSAVVNDIASIAKNIVNKTKPEYGYNITTDDKVLDICEQSFSYYLRVNTDKTLVKITDLLDIFANRNIIVNTIDKFEKKQDGNVTLDYVITTDNSLEYNFNQAKIGRASCRERV